MFGKDVQLSHEDIRTWFSWDSCSTWHVGSRFKYHPLFTPLLIFIFGKCHELRSFLGRPNYAISVQWKQSTLTRSLRKKEQRCYQFTDTTSKYFFTMLWSCVQGQDSRSGRLRRAGVRHKMIRPIFMFCFWHNLATMACVVIAYSCMSPLGPLLTLIDNTFYLGDVSCPNICPEIFIFRGYSVFLDVSSWSTANSDL